jgi:MFS family permease
MAQTFRSILVILFSLALLVSGSSLLGTLLAVRMSIEGFAHQWIGPILAFHSFGFVAGTLYCARIIRRVGHIRSVAAFAAIACVAALAHPLWVNGFGWAALRAASGFCGAGLIMVMESWINDRTSNELRGTIMAVYSATNYLAQGGGQFTLGLGEPETFALFSVSAALIAASLVPLALTRSKAPVIERHERMSVRRLFAVAPIGIVGALAAGAAMSAMLGVLPVYAQTVGYGVGLISVLMGTVVLFGMAMQWPVGRLSDRRDRRGLIVLLSLLGLLVSVPLATQDGRAFPLLLVLAGLFVGLVGTIYPLCVALTNDYLHSHQMVSASATLLLIFGVGTIIGPIGGSLMMELFGPRGLFLFTAGVMVVLVVFGLYRHLTAKRFPVDEQAEYVPIANASTAVILEIDPRNQEFEPSVKVPLVDRRLTGRPDRRRGRQSGGRRRSDGADFNE